MSNSSNNQLPERGIYTWGSFVLDGLEILSHLKLSKDEYRIFLFLCSRMNHEDNTAYLKQVEIHEALKIDRSNISKSLVSLNIHGLLIKNQKGFMINPYVFYIGKTSIRSRDNLKNKFHKLFYEANQTPLTI